MSLSSKNLFAVVMTVVLFAACGETQNKGGTNSPEFKSVTFAIQNVGRSSVFTDLNAFSIYADDTKLQLAGPCACGENCTDDEPPIFSELSPGAIFFASWDGEIVAAGQCRPADLAGKTLEAEFCYGANYDGIFNGYGQATDVECVRIPFSAADTEVKYTIENTVEPAESPFRVTLENLGQAPIFVQIAKNCVSDTWYKLKHGDEEINTSAECLCDCAEGPCEILCAEICPADQTMEIANGESLAIEISNVYSQIITSDVGQCTQRQFLPAPLEIEVCWGTEITGEVEGASVIGGTIECRTEPLDLTGSPLVISVGGARL